MATHDEPKVDSRGTGDSTNTRGEDIQGRDGKEAGRYDSGKTGADRPSGKSTARDATGVDPSEPMDDETNPSGTANR